MRKALWAPWRMQFILKTGNLQGSCLFCGLSRRKPSAKNLILQKARSAFVVLNRYPYTNGHLMVVPSRHIGRFEQLKDEEHMEIGRLLARSIGILKKGMRSQGFNVGVNLGRVAGAGIRGHLHFHVVPRWAGDSNFMPVVGGVRTMPEYIVETYKRVAPLFKKI